MEARPRRRPQSTAGEEQELPIFRANEKVFSIAAEHYACTALAAQLIVRPIATRWTDRAIFWATVLESSLRSPTLYAVRRLLIAVHERWQQNTLWANNQCRIEFG
jgi:hypothetical protein